jgi:hypothetical protein
MIAMTKDCLQVVVGRCITVTCLQLSGFWFKDLAMDHIDDIISALITEPMPDDPKYRPPHLSKEIARLARRTPPLALFV